MGSVSISKLETDRNSVSVTVSVTELPNFLVSAWFRLRPQLAFWFRPGFGYGRNSKLSFGIVTASRNSDIEFGKYGIMLQPFPNAVSACPYAKLAVVLRDPARRAKVVTPLAGSQWEFILDSRHSLSYLIFRPSGRDIGLGVGDHIGLVARQR